MVRDCTRNQMVCDVAICFLAFYAHISLRNNLLFDLTAATARGEFLFIYCTNLWNRLFCYSNKQTV